MIQANQTWVNALGQQAKRPLYVLQIPAFGICLASFSTAPAKPIIPAPGAGGWGVYAWGTNAWGN